MNAIAVQTDMSKLEAVAPVPGVMGYRVHRLPMMMNVNWWGVLHGHHVFVPRMRQQPGVIAAVQDPNRFSRLVLLAPSPRHTDDPYDGYVGGLLREDIEGLLASLDSNHRRLGRGPGADGHGQPAGAGISGGPACQLLPDKSRHRTPLRRGYFLFRHPP
ncbi:hypothetical protein [Pseudarthrobacter sp. fls2-241-R2A-168]|uniref:hypothetical protein n=1 Tax=Pseudarthrobacter sp. fls2-241-R2A-168 TaxID=3040304 RepID=UPI002553D85D|nr:hypothetical protein [Pseudarthrobacter sp. fls2-241-R2A-168]